MSVFVERTDLNDVDQLLTIANAELGNNFLREEDVLSSVNKHLCLSAKIDNVIIGFLVFKTVNASQLDEYLFKGIEQIQSILARDQITLIKHVAVLEAFKRKGIGTTLIQFVLREPELIKGTFLAVAWENKGKVALKNILERSGFRGVFVVDEYWRENSLEKQYDCPACGQPPCLCKAHFFLK